MFRRFDELNAKQLEDLRKQSREKKFLVIVHPNFFGENKELDEFLGSKRKNKFITLIMDCKSNIEQIEKRNNPKITKEDLIFAVHTIKNSDPQPSMGWQRLIRKLELAGSKKVILSGMLFAETNTQLLEKAIRSTKGLKSKRQRKENSMNRVVLRAMKMHGKTNGEYAGCAGLTKARLIATGKFDVKTTKHFSKPLIRLFQKANKR